MENMLENKKDKSSQEICPNASKNGQRHHNRALERAKRAYPPESRSFVASFFGENGRANPLKELLSTRDQLQVCAYLAYFLDGRETSLATSMVSMSKLARQIAADAGKLASAMDNLEGIDIFLRTRPFLRSLPSRLRLLEADLDAILGANKRTTKPSHAWNDVWLVCASLIVENRTKSWHDEDLLDLIQTRLRYGLDEKEALDEDPYEPHISKKRDRVIEDLGFSRIACGRHTEASAKFRPLQRRFWKNHAEGEGAEQASRVVALPGWSCRGLKYAGLRRLADRSDDSCFGEKVGEGCFTRDEA